MILTACASAPKDEAPSDPGTTETTLPTTDLPDGTTDPDDTGPDPDTDTDTASPELEPGCDGVPGSGLIYDDCGVCGGPHTDTEDDCTVPWLLGHVMAAERGSRTGTVEIEGCEGEERSVYDYTCLTDAAEQTTWFSCSRNPQTDDCAHPGEDLKWDAPVDHQAACEAHFGTLASPGAAAASYPEAVGGVREVAMRVDDDPSAAAFDSSCPVYACETSYCRDEDATVPPDQCGTPPSAVLRNEAGVDWSVPDWAGVPTNSGYFGKVRTPGSGIQWAAASVGWRHLHTGPETFERSGSGGITYDLVNSVQTEVLDDVARGDVPYWLRIYTAAEDWAPTWLDEACPEADTFEYTFGEEPNETTVNIQPIWDDCIWNEMLNMYKVVLSDASCEPDSSGALPPTCPISANDEPINVDGWDLKSDENLRMVYVPGAFRYVEYGLGAIEAAAESGKYGTDFEANYTAWFTDRMVADLVALMGDDAHKLVFTGEDMPYSIPSGWDTDRLNHLPMEAVAAGMSIRNGITENHSSHHYHMPAYGTFVDWSGHVVADEDWVAYDGQRVLATEQECFNVVGEGQGCGSTYYDLTNPQDYEDFEYEVTRANLVSLQARMNHMYVKPAVMEVDGMTEHWAWVEANLSQRPEDAIEAWVTLGLYRDKFFESDGDDHDWIGRPWVQNTEKHIAQRDVCGGGRTRPGSKTVAGDNWECDPVRMTNIEGRQTDQRQRQFFIYFDVHERFSDGPADYELAVTYVDSGAARWHVEYGQEGCLGTTEAVTNGGTDELRTVWFALDQAVFDDALPGATDLRIYSGGGDDIEVRMVRLVRRGLLGCGDGVRTESEACDDGNTEAGDGCDPTCAIEEHWSCDGAAPDTCGCADGWDGVDCSEPVCHTGCDGHGTCIAPNICDCDAGYQGADCSTPGDPVSCAAILDAGEAWFGSGMYTIRPTGSDSAIEVYCDMETDEGGWTIVWASTDGCSAGRPWDAVPTAPDDCGTFGSDPHDGRVRLAWADLLAIDQEEHILIRPAYPDSWLQDPWLKVEHAFFPSTGLTADDDPLSVSVYTAADPARAISAELGFSTDEALVEKGGWYGLAVVDAESGWRGLTKDSSSRLWTNNDCTGLLVGVYRDAHLFSTELFDEDSITGEVSFFDWDFLGWPATSEGCASSTEGTVTTWIGVR